MDLVKILLTSIAIWTFGNPSLNANNTSKNSLQNIFRSFDGRDYSLSGRGIKILYSKEGNPDFISIGYDLNSDGKIDLVASFKVKKIKPNSISAGFKAEAVVIDEDNDGIFDYNLEDTNKDGFFDVRREFTKYEKTKYNLKNLKMVKINYLNFRKLMKK